MTRKLSFLCWIGTIGTDFLTNVSKKFLCMIAWQNSSQLLLWRHIWQVMFLFQFLAKWMCTFVNYDYSFAYKSPLLPIIENRLRKLNISGYFSLWIFQTYWKSVPYYATPKEIRTKQYIRNHDSVFSFTMAKTQRKMAGKISGASHVL